MNEPPTRLLDTTREAPTRLCSEELRRTLLERERAARAKPASRLRDGASMRRPRTSRRTLWLAGAGALVIVGAAVVAVTTGISFSRQASRSAATIGVRQAASAPSRELGPLPVPSSARASPTAEPPTLAPPPSAAARAPASEADAVDALARGDYARAAALYQTLADAHPTEPVFALVHGVMERRLAERCAHGACP
jgi:hypothetical protein